MLSNTLKNLVIISFLFTIEILKGQSGMNFKSKNIFDYKVKDISGNELTLEKFKDKKILIVNVASNCGYTRQYKDLQKLHEQYEDKLQILAFPCNDFGRQEPGTAEEIIEFCEINYGVTFPIMEKIKIKNTPIHPIYKWLGDSELNGWNDKKPRWNFHKYLIDEKGNLIDTFNSGTNPLSSTIIKHL